MNGNKTISGKLAIGIEYNGKLHRDFVLRLPTVGDEIDVAEDEHIPDAGYTVGVAACCLVSLGDIPEGDITYDLLRQMDSGDYCQLAAARDTLKKKRSDSSKSTGTSGTTASGSGGTGTRSAK